jgi:hypothetical protein
MGTIPGMVSLATGMMKKKIEKANIPSLADLQEMAQIEGVELVACKMTVDMMEIDEKKPIEGVVVWAKRKSSSNTPSRAKYACLGKVTPISPHITGFLEPFTCKGAFDQLLWDQFGVTGDESGCEQIDAECQGLSQSNEKGGIRHAG